MAKIETKTIKAEAAKTPSSKTEVVELTNSDQTTKVTAVEKRGPSEERGQEPTPSSEAAPGVIAEDRQVLRRAGAKMLTSVQINGSVSISCPMDKEVDLALQHGAQGLVEEFAPADAVESTFAPVIVGIRNAVMTHLHLATKASGIRRDIEVNTAFKGAGVLVELLEAFDAHRGHGGRRFTVGNVNVECGGEAIVGNVETTPRQKPRPEDSASEPNRRKPRA